MKIGDKVALTREITIIDFATGSSRKMAAGKKGIIIKAFEGATSPSWCVKFNGTKKMVAVMEDKMEVI